MLTQTTESAIKALVYVTLRGKGRPVPPREIAEHIGASATYMAKVARLLVKADILRSHRGALGGITLARSPSEITLREIVEACQGRILGNYCEGSDDEQAVCAFHVAMLELHRAIVGTLSRWTLADLAAKPLPSSELANKVACRMEGVCPIEEGRTS